MISNNLHKIRIRTLDYEYNYVDELCINIYSYSVSKEDRRLFRKESRINKKNLKFNQNPEE
jgi:hypothetical protein